MADAALQGHDHERPGFFTRWFMSTNHKDIGILYLFTAGFVGLISVIFTVYMRMELMEPGVQYMCAEGARVLSAAAEGESPVVASIICPRMVCRDSFSCALLAVARNTKRLVNKKK